MNAYERTFATLRGEERDRLPNQPLLMTLAARWSGVRYRDYVLDHRVLVDAQLRAAEEFEVDSVTCCSDAWREAADLGAKVLFFEDDPPGCSEHLLDDKASFARLRPPPPGGGPRMADRIAACELFAQRVKGEVPITGWVEGPVAESADLRGLTALMIDTVDDLPFVLDLFDWVTDLETRFALDQVSAGADIIGIGDAASSLVSPDFYGQHVYPRVRRMVDAIHGAGAAVRLHVCGDTSHLLRTFGELGADILEIDFPVPFGDVRPRVGPQATLLGNLHPVAAVRDSSPERIRADLARCYEVAGPRYIVGAGCELPPDTSPENLRAFAAFAKSAR